MVRAAVCPSCLPSLGSVGNQWTAFSSSFSAPLVDQCPVSSEDRRAVSQGARLGAETPRDCGRVLL